jgi:hypothetical protein
VEVAFKVTRVLESSDFDETDPMITGYRLAEGQVLRMQAKGTHRGLAIHSVDIVTNKTLKEKFEKKKAELAKAGCGESKLLFHGTPQANVEGILKDNFDLSRIANGRAHGNGVYFSEQPEVSLGYAKLLVVRKGNKRRKVEQKGEPSGSLILCEVVQGKNSKEVKHGKDERCWAIVVPDVDQILPKYVVNFH